MTETKTSEKSRAGKGTVRDKLLALLHTGAPGVAAWNARPPAARLKVGPYRQADLAGADLRGIELSSPFGDEDKVLDFQEAVFDNANLAGANLDQTNFSQASFRRADCRQVRLRGARCQFAHFEEAQLQQARLRGTLFNNAAFAGTDLSGADLSFANLCDADLSGANLAGVKFDSTKYNAGTQFPDGFVASAGLEFLEAIAFTPRSTGTRKSGRVLRTEGRTFLERLEKRVNSGRFGRALDMLRAERFHLFSQVEDGQLVGVVKSQREPDLVYSCSLDREGRFSCCSQKLEECMGLRGALCKHIMVLIVGLTRTGNIDPDVVLEWVDASLGRKNHLDVEKASAVLLRYKGAEAGEIDWRPTETIPEDFYTF
jgi:hypothetical protein